MATVNIDLHILKKVIADLKKSEDEMQKTIIHFTKAKKHLSESLALIEFVEGEVDKGGI